MLDFHSHILPSMDDGSKSWEMSLCMLEASFSMGVHGIAATPHFYADAERPSDFLRRRREAAFCLAQKYKPATCPDVVLGAEVAFFHGISRCGELPELCLEGTNCLLVEMPFERWPASVVEELFAIHDLCGLVPIVAHIERYIFYQPRDVLGELIRNGVLIQANAEAFLSFRTKRKMLRLLEMGGCPSPRNGLPQYAGSFTQYAGCASFYSGS